MAERSYTSRRELDQYVFPPAVTVLAPLACILVQAVLPKAWGALADLDLPLIAVIYFAVARRSPIAGTITGALVGLFQDGLTSHPFGVIGIAKAIVGYMASSVGFAVDMDNVLNRVAATFAFSLLQSGILFLVERWLLGDATFHMRPVHALICAVANAVVAVPLFFVLDRFRMRE